MRRLAAAARAAHPSPTFAGRVARLVFIARQLIQLRHGRQWLDYLQQPEMAPVVAANPSLYRKIIRPYLSREWMAAEKVTVLIHHYDFMRQVLPPGRFTQMSSPGGIDLAVLPVSRGECLVLRLRADAKFRKEGEITLELISSRYQCRVSSLTFVVAADQRGTRALLIGAVHGLDQGVDKNIIKEVAKSVHGLRPKSLLLIAVQELAEAWNVPEILGTGSRIHTSRHAAYWLNRSRQFVIAYDEFWLESGGHLRPDGFFQLPGRFVERPLYTFPAHKRPLYRQRYAWIAETRMVFRRRIASWQPTVPLELLPALPVDPIALPHSA